MIGDKIPIEDRSNALAWYVERCIKKGFAVVSRSDVSAELHKPAGFPALLRPAQTRYVIVDDFGCITVRKKGY